MKKIIENISLAVLEGERAIKLAVSALLAKGHIIVEDVPGVGKTTLGLAMAKSLDIDFKRIQFVADLLPADILGVTIYDPNKAQFIFRPGPIFTSFLLADEINRGTSRVQSALLEVMNTAQISIDGQVYSLPQPFFVMATLNPLESSGVFPLPESQLDRFMIRFSMGYPTRETEKRLIDDEKAPKTVEELKAVADAKRVEELRNKVLLVKIENSIIDFIMDIIEATRNHPSIMLGASPRAARHLCAMCKAWAFIHDRDYIIPDDVKELAIPVLAHRLILRNFSSGTMAQEKILMDLLSGVKVPR